MKKLPVILFIILVAACITAGVISFFACEPSTHTLQVDFSLPEGEITHGATGWLYGIAEDEVPSSDLLTPLAPQIACVKAPGGTQHPIGDVLNVAETFLKGGGKYLFVYMQDIYPDWYYKYQGQEDYVQKVKEMSAILSAQEYSGKLIYCPFNESDNGEWYGDLDKEANMQKFYADWSAVYSAIKEIDGDAFIAGPGFMRYDEGLFKDFYSLCLEGDNLPDMAVWHELSSDSYYKFEDRYESYRAVEEELGISELPICISEYGQMTDNGIPGKMLQYISAFESKKVYACVAYWRLANNLGELSADATTPTSAWWVYRRYAQMSGESYSFKNMNQVTSHVRGIAAKDGENVLLLAGGGSGEIKINMKNLPFEDGDIYADIEYAEYDGLGAACVSPHDGGCVKLSVTGGIAALVMQNCREDRAYFIRVSASGEEREAEENVRLQAEDAALTDENGKKKSIARADNVAYASSGDIVTLSAGDTLTFTYNSPEGGERLLQVCYASGTAKDGERVNVSGEIEVNGQVFPVTYENTLSDSTTTALELPITIKQGVNTVSVRASGEISADFIDISEAGSEEYLLSPAGEGKFAAVVPHEGYYLPHGGSAGIYSLTENTAGALYLKRGVNILTASGAEYLTPASGEELVLQGEFSCEIGDETRVTGEENSLTFTTPALEGGVYALTLTYSNSAEDGSHAYNVDLAERYAQIYVNGEEVRTVFFRNTYAWDNFKTITLYLRLEGGAAEISLSCNGEYAPATGQAAFLPVLKTTAVLAKAAE